MRLIVTHRIGDNTLPISIDETIISVAGAASERPRRRRGRRVHVSWVYCWSTRGCRGVVLETLHLGGARCGSKEALRRIFERFSEPGQGVGGGHSKPGPIVGRRTVVKRQREASEAARSQFELATSGKSPRASGRAAWARILSSGTSRAIATGLGALWAGIRLAMFVVEQLCRH